MSQERFIRAGYHSSWLMSPCRLASCSVLCLHAHCPLQMAAYRCPAAKPISPAAPQLCLLLCMLRCCTGLLHDVRVLLQVLLHWACAKVSASADTADEALLSALDSRLKGQPAIRFCPGPAGHGSVHAYAP